MEKEIKKTSNFQKILIFSFLLIISLIVLYINRSVSYNTYDRIQFESGGATLYANLYHPAEELNFQERHPLLIYAHPFASQRDLELRIPIEFTKRGFFVAAVDYQGHGESGGNLFNLGQDNIPALAKDCSNLLNAIEILDIYNHINSSQIGLIGHSLGGMVVLMNDALDNRFTATVTWAGLVDLDPNKVGLPEDSVYVDYIPVNYINQSNVENLLVIHHVNDQVLPYEKNAVAAQNLTNCSLITIRQPMPGVEHYLLSDFVLIETINFFEASFFNSETTNGPIFITYYYNYVLLSISFVFLFLTSIYLILYFSKYFSIAPEENKPFIEYSMEEKNQKSSIKNIFLYFLIFIGTYIFFSLVFGALGLLMGSVVLLLSYLIFKLKNYYDNFTDKREFLRIIIKTVSLQFQLNLIGFALLSVGIFLGFYLLFSISYPFAFFFPSNISNFFLALTAYPLFLNLEILYRKVIYPELDFLQSEKKKRAAMIIMAFIMQILIYGTTLDWIVLPGFLATNIVVFVVMVKNTILYEETRNILSTIISSFIIIQIFFGATISSVFGIGEAINFVI